MKLDIENNRTQRKYPRSIMALRVAWSVFGILFTYSPRTAFGWRSFILRSFGATVGKNVHIYNSSIIYMPWNLEIDDWSSIGEWVLIYNLGKVRIGSRATISHKAHICAGTHQYNDASLPLIKSPVSIGSQAWVCAEAFVGPGVCVGEGAIVGARAVAVKDVSPWTIVAGNPANIIGQRVLNTSRDQIYTK